MGLYLLDTQYLYGYYRLTEEKRNEDWGMTIDSIDQHSATKTCTKQTKVGFLKAHKVYV